MGVTFIIGNGFDLSLGMKTRYADVYEEYVKEENENPVIQAFKDSLKKDKEKQCENWTDFEMGMAQYAGVLKEESKLVLCVRDFRKFLTEYLKKQEGLFENMIEAHSKTNAFCNAFVDGIQNYAASLTPNEQRLLSKNVEFPSFLTFNYTRSIEMLVEKRSSKEKIDFYLPDPIHIHNDLGGTIVLGVDNEHQVPLKLSNTGRHTFVKQAFNVRYDDERVKKVIRTIHESSTICIYGWSMGESDEFWVDTVGKWLLGDESNHLVWYAYGTPLFASYERDAQMDEEDEQKKKLLGMLHLSDQYSILEKQIHVVLGKGMFNFPSLNNENIGPVLVPNVS